MNLLVVDVFIIFVLYVWAFYNIPILLIGVKNRKKEYQKNKRTAGLNEKLPLVSILVPVKDEEMVIGRLLEALLRQNYPPEKMEIIIIEDGSLDSTMKICKEYAKRYPSQVKLIHQPMSNGKPSALNYGLKHVRSEIVAVFDADGVPEPDAVLKAVEYLKDYSVAAVQGKIRSINADQNMITKFVSYEETIAFDIYLQGKDTLNMFVPLTGSCYFIRKSVIEEIGGWNDKSLSEDLEMSVRLTLRGYKIKYVPDIESWLESSANVTQLITQRLRWFRGSMELALKYGKLATKLNRKNADIEFTLTCSYMLPLCFLGFMIAISGFFVPFQPDPVSVVIAYVAMLLTIILFLVTGIVLAYVTNQRKTTDLKWLPFIYVYWIAETFIATYAFIQIVLRRPRKWAKTQKTGVVANSALDTNS